MKFTSQLRITIIFLLLIMWSKRDDFFVFMQNKPRPELLDFNRNGDDSKSNPVVVSADEEINIDVFEKAHPAVVNIAATTLGMNFWLEIIPKEGQGSGFLIDRNGYILTNHYRRYI